MFNAIVEMEKINKFHWYPKQNNKISRQFGTNVKCKTEHIGVNQLNACEYPMMHVS